MKKEKDYNLSMIRFISMAMIIFCHTFEFIGYSFGYSNKLGILGNFLAVGVSLFLLLSGYLYGCKDYHFQDSKERIQFIIQNCKKLLIDYYIYIFVFIIPVYYFISPQLLTKKALFKLLTFSGTLPGINHLWFIPYILFCYLLTPYFYDLKNFLKSKAKNSDLKYIFYILICMLVFEILGYAFNSYFSIVRINTFFIGLSLFPLLEEKIKKLNRGKKILILIESIILLLSIIFWYYLRYVITPNLENSHLRDLAQYGTDYLCLIQGLALFYFYSLLGKALSKIKIIKKILDFSDYFSYDIYISHMIFIKGSLSLLKITPYYLVNIFISFIPIIICGIILKYLSICFIKKKIILKRTCS